MTPDLPAGAALTTGAVARRLGVSPTTLRSWERRYAIGPADREDGRHRRWTPADIARLELMCRLTSQGVPPSAAARAALAVDPTDPGALAEPALAEPAPAGPGPAGGRVPGGPNALPLGEAVRQECRGLARAAVRLDAPAVADLLAAAVAEHGLIRAWEEVMAPTLHAVGRKWASAGERYVEVEHLLSWHVSTVLRGVRPGPEAPGTAPVLLACMPGEQHSLPIEALGAALGERGVPVRMFGAALPADALRDAVRRLGPSVVTLWSQGRGTADRSLVRAVGGIEWGVRGARAQSALLLAGPGWSGAAPERTGGPRVERLHGLRSAVETITGLLTPLTPLPV
ncbi:MerR family transcriptional regulator [Streptomyces sp. BI20]|uniref:MerR family transcriptional regulator n=1 Tax=Streptomyces sp. BI20 TaxID=3403460 RepID=UPI003C78FB52